jgi:hypothetical protein
MLLWRCLSKEASNADKQGSRSLTRFEMLLMGKILTVDQQVGGSSPQLYQ